MMDALLCNSRRPYAAWSKNKMYAPLKQKKSFVFIRGLWCDGVKSSRVWVRLWQLAKRHFEKKNNIPNFSWCVQ
jgi:hypothetical protein